MICPQAPQLDMITYDVLDIARMWGFRNLQSQWTLFHTYLMDLKVCLSTLQWWPPSLLYRRLDQYPKDSSSRSLCVDIEIEALTYADTQVWHTHRVHNRHVWAKKQWHCAWGACTTAPHSPPPRVTLLFHTHTNFLTCPQATKPKQIKNTKRLQRLPCVKLAQNFWHPICTPHSYHYSGQSCCVCCKRWFVTSDMFWCDYIHSRMTNQSGIIVMCSDITISTISSYKKLWCKKYDIAKALKNTDLFLACTFKISV